MIRVTKNLSKSFHYHKFNCDNQKRYIAIFRSYSMAAMVRLPTFAVILLVIHCTGPVDEEDFLAKGIYDNQPVVRVSRSQAQNVANRTPTNSRGLPLYESNPGASFVLFLDFDGGNYNNETNYDGASLDSNYRNFSSTERTAIVRAAMEVAQGYALFDVNVTTDNSVRRGARKWSWIIITNEEGSSGKARVGSLSRSTAQAYAGANAVFRPPKNQRGYILIHELGHTFGLRGAGDCRNGKYYDWEDLPSSVTGRTGSWMGGRHDNDYFTRYIWMNIENKYCDQQNAIRIIGRHTGYSNNNNNNNNNNNDCHNGLQFGHSNYCSSSCRCGVGEGDCDNDNQCKSGLVCSENVGANYGTGPKVDICEKKSSSSGNCHNGLQFGHSNYCSSSCRCDVGEGDCDNDDQCKPGLVCSEDVGANYGTGPNVDICE